ncbi:coiled-coil domain-containing protein 81 isoform X2 [Saccopteryx bilineata]|uniref:coiled-coil domain-containing protein 81 isoform X2 n=1 Tax=Saccopteryx bilineata TaxID=59482 RepID=UPI00338E0400
MLDTIIPSLQGRGRNVLPTLPLLSQEEVSTIWEHVSEFVGQQLSQYKGAHIPGLGAFTFIRQKLDVGSNKFILFQRPTFIMAEKLLQLHGLQQKKRPGTEDSVLSSREALKKPTDNVLTFPRIESKEMKNKPLMETIVEEQGKNKPKECKLKEGTDKEAAVTELLSLKKLQDRKSISPGKVKGVDLANKLEQSGRCKKDMHHPASLPSPRCLKNDNKMKPEIFSATSCQDHDKAGQEMCYVCLQRAQQNFPIYYSEERRRREKEDEQLLQQYQMLRDQESFLEQQMRNLAIRRQNQENAAFNLGVAEAMKIYKTKKPEFHKSFLLDKRPFSHENNALKEEHFKSLRKQMVNKREKELNERKNQKLMEHLEQVQLAEELAAQRAKYIQDKMEETECYKRDLDAQIKNKSSQLPAFESVSSAPVFGKDERALMTERRLWEQNCMKHQLEESVNRKRKAILSQLADREWDLQVLQKTRKEYLADKRAEAKHVNRINRSLQEDWRRSVEMKRQRELEEKAFQRASDKVFLLDQCDKYQRCKQCQRSMCNTGSSNLWPLNKHLHGSRLFV